MIHDDIAFGQLDISGYTHAAWPAIFNYVLPAGGKSATHALVDDVAACVFPHSCNISPFWRRVKCDMNAQMYTSPSNFWLPVLVALGWKVGSKICECGKMRPDWSWIDIVPTSTIQKHTVHHRFRINWHHRENVSTGWKVFLFVVTLFFPQRK